MCMATTTKSREPISYIQDVTTADLKRVNHFRAVWVVLLEPISREFLDAELAYRAEHS